MQDPQVAEEPLGQFRELLAAASRMKRLRGTDADRALALDHATISANSVIVRVKISGESYAARHSRAALDQALAAADRDPYVAGALYDDEWALILHQAAALIVKGVSMGHVGIEVEDQGIVRPVPGELPDRGGPDPQGVLALQLAELLARSMYSRPTRPSLQCQWCGGPIRDAKRLNRRYCSDSHYKAAWRATKRIDAAAAVRGRAR